MQSELLLINIKQYSKSTTKLHLARPAIEDMSVSANSIASNFNELY